MTSHHSLRTASAQQQCVDVYDCSACARWCLLVPSGTGAATKGPLSLCAAGITLGVLVPPPTAERLAHVLARDGGAVLRKSEILRWMPPGLAELLAAERAQMSATATVSLHPQLGAKQ